jgi:hypothetical protein
MFNISSESQSPISNKTNSSHNATPIPKDSSTVMPPPVPDNEISHTKSKSKFLSESAVTLQTRKEPIPEIIEKSNQNEEEEYDYNGDYYNEYGEEYGEGGEPKIIWQKCYDVNNECYYYYNTETEETQWEEPIGEIYEEDEWTAQWTASILADEPAKVEEQSNHNVDAYSYSDTSSLELTPSNTPNKYENNDDQQALESVMNYMNENDDSFAHRHELPVAPRIIKRDKSKSLKNSQTFKAPPSAFRPSQNQVPTNNDQNSPSAPPIIDPINELLYAIPLDQVTTNQYVNAKRSSSPIAEAVWENTTGSPLSITPINQSTTSIDQSSSFDYEVEESDDGSISGDSVGSEIEVDVDLKKRLMEMGFSNIEAEAALHATGNNLSAAVPLLIKNEANEITSSRSDNYNGKLLKKGSEGGSITKDVSKFFGKISASASATLSAVRPGVGKNSGKDNNKNQRSVTSSLTRRMGIPKMMGSSKEKVEKEKEFDDLSSI